MFVVGLDVGYSNLKIAAGDAGDDPRVTVRPAGAAPLDRLGEPVGGTPGAVASNDRPILVDVGGLRWAAAIEPERFEGWQRPLHEDYAGTLAYQALAKAAFLLAGRRSIDRVVTGLPVSQAGDARRRDQLTRLLVGRHALADGIVEVAEVRVVPQPVGAYLDLVYSATDEGILERIETGAVIVLDAGYYSFDWTLLVRGELRRTASGTSLEAMSVLLERASRHAVEEAGGRPSHWAWKRRCAPGAPTCSRQDGGCPWRPCSGGPPDRSPAWPWRPCARRCAERRTASIWSSSPGAEGRTTGPRWPDSSPVLRWSSAPDPVSANARGFFRYAR